MKKTERIEKFVRNNDLEYVTLADGTEAIIGKMDFMEMYHFAHLNHLRVQVVIQRDGGEWTLSEYIPTEGVDIKYILYNENLGHNYCNLYYKNYVDELLQTPLTERLIQNGAKPSEFIAMMEEVKAVKELLESGKAGYDKPLQIVINRETLSVEVISQSPTYVSFHGITYAVAMMEVTKQMTLDIKDRALNHGAVTCIAGQMPEELFEILTEEEKDKHDLSICPKESEYDHYLFGPFIVLDTDNFLGYAYRTSFDGKIWYWSGGEHTNITLAKSDDLFPYHSIISEDTREERSHDLDVAAWQIPDIVETDRYGELIKMPK